MICNYEGCTCSNNAVSSCSDRDCPACMTGLSVLVSILGGIVFAIVTVLLFTNGLITDFTPAVWIAVISALVYLFALLFAGLVPCCRNIRCIRCLYGTVIAGIFGTIFSGILAVATDLAAGSVFAIILVALVSFFFAYMIVSTLFLLKCGVTEE